jgi:hypothetical protein
MTPLPRIERLARRLWRITTALLILLPLLVLGGLVWGYAHPDWLTRAFPGLPAGTALTGAKSMAVVLVGAVGLGPVLYALVQMRDLFARYRRAEILSPACGRAIRRTGAALMLLALWQTIALPLQIGLLTLDNPPGGKQLTLQLSSETMWLLLAGGLLLTIGWVMAEAARVAEENAGFI